MEQGDLTQLGHKIHDLVTASLDGDLKPCGEANLTKLSSTLKSLVDDSLQPDSNASESAVLDRHTSTLSKLKDECDAQFRAVSWKDVHRCWRRLYTDVILVWAVLDLMRVRSHTRSCHRGGDLLGKTIHRLDLAIIVAATPGRGRREVCMELIKIGQRLWDEVDQQREGGKGRQGGKAEYGSEDDDDADGDRPRKKTRVMHQDVDEHSTVHDPSSCSSPLHVRAQQSIPELRTPPSLDDFAAEHCKQPFVLRGFANDWPAFDEYPQDTSADASANATKSTSASTSSKWSSGEFLSSIAGRGRVVPVEIGREYTDDEWTQEIMPWRDFLQHSGFLSGPTTSKASSNGNDRNNVYLAQHTLLEQFTDLKRDILLPDYVYALPPNISDMFPVYSPPIITVERRLNDRESENEDKDKNDGGEFRQEQGVMTLLWIGPKDTLSPAHTDPYFNCFVQVVGSKAVWVAPPQSNENGAMYGFGAEPSSSPRSSSSHSSSPSPPPPQDLTQLMTNTSQVPVFEQGPTPPLYEDPHPAFTDTVEPLAMYTILRAGDMLFLPPGWWHSIKSLEKSVSVSMWF